MSYFNFVHLLNFSTAVMPSRTVHHVWIIGATIIALYCILPLTVRHSNTSILNNFLPCCRKFKHIPIKTLTLIDCHVFKPVLNHSRTSIHKSAKTSTSGGSWASQQCIYVQLYVRSSRPSPFPQGGFCE